MKQSKHRKCRSLFANTHHILAPTKLAFGVVVGDTDDGGGCGGGCAGVEDVKVDSAGNKLTVTGKVDPAKIKEKLEEKTNKKVEIVSPQPKKDGGGGDKKAEEKPEKKTEDKKAEDKKPKEVHRNLRRKGLSV